jgi:diacylglycerol kinase
MINTAIEILADKISSEPDELIGKAKDVAAGAVFIAAIFSVIVAAIIFRKYLF